MLFESHMEIDHDSDTDFHKENDEKECKEGSKHPRGLLPGAAAAEEAHDGDQGPHAQQDVGAQVVVSPLVSAGLQIQVAETRNMSRKSSKSHIHQGQNVKTQNWLYEQFLMTKSDLSSILSICSNEPVKK